MLQEPTKNENQNSDQSENLNSRTWQRRKMIWGKTKKDLANIANKLWQDPNALKKLEKAQDRN